MIRFFAGMILVTSGVAASDSVPVQQPPTDDSIAAAKHDLDSLKTSSANAEVGTKSGGLPIISVPQLHVDDSPDSVPTTVNSPIDAAKQAEKKKANWLVDAMMNPQDEQKRDAKHDRLENRRRRDDSLSGPNGKKSDLRAGAAEDTKSAPDEASDATEKAPQPSNPLAQYMANWVTPQDYGMLRRTVEAPIPNGPTSGGVPAVPAPGSDALSALTGVDVGAIAPPASPPKTIDPASNPYLAAFALPGVAPEPTPAPVPLTPPSTWAVPLFAPEPASKPPPPTIPDFAKPSSDDKVFKPLKRF